jgi:iron complex outermembrane receptor protein
VNGVPLEIRTLPVTDTLARLLGARDLRPEKSMNYGLGFAIEPVPALSLTADYYRIDIKDRIVFSENFVDPSGDTTLVHFFRAQGKPEITGARYFTNALNTRTDGVDVIANFGHSFANSGVLRLTAGVNVNHTRLTRIDSIAQQTAVAKSLLQFGRVEQVRVERGQPRDNIILSSNYNLHGVGALLRTQRFGKVTTAGAVTTDTLDQTFGAKWITDASLSYTVARIYTFTAGVDNLFDVYPDRNSTPGIPLDGPGGTPGLGASRDAGNGNYGIFPYSGVSPFGFNGRFVYGKLSIYL